MTSPARRTVLRGAALAGAAGFCAAACGSANGRDAALPTAPVELGAASEVPVGGARLYRDHKLVVSQPSEGQYKAFSAVCTHAGCVVDKVEKGRISCPCHGSAFDAATGKVLAGPAGAPLPECPVKAEGGRLVAGPAA
ncbi:MULTISPECIES: Rieske (2Fe-2S) protein [Streptomyces]|uniref:Cytochrome bc1 complex Rieske iron-sulfur subunit n=1 Tax=Streptomyces luteosporeus TaxID=173856 RepID=A0ABP6GC07_9ACTN